MPLDLLRETNTRLVDLPPEAEAVKAPSMTVNDYVAAAKKIRDFVNALYEMDQKAFDSIRDRSYRKMTKEDHARLLEQRTTLTNSLNKIRIDIEEYERYQNETNGSREDQRKTLRR